ncbi:MAG: hypothetical protein AAF609_10165 [Cyanobacteria bacterium P01_C01_bin.120]
MIDWAASGEAIADVSSPSARSLVHDLWSSGTKYTQTKISLSHCRGRGGGHP